MDDHHLIGMTVNGRSVELAVEGRQTLAEILRSELRLVGTHVGCEHGVCGACTVLLDGAPVRSCLLFAVQVDGRSVETVESLGGSTRLDALQEAFSRHHALQCGFCTPGFLMLATAYLREAPPGSREEIRDLVSSNLCRCTGYTPIIDAIAEVAGEANGHGASDGAP